MMNDVHPAIQFTMETAVNNSLPFVGTVITMIKMHDEKREFLAWL